MDVMGTGVVKGFHVGIDGSVTAGVLVTSEGIRIEETAPFSVVVPPGHATLFRKDKVICRHTYEKTVPAPAATWEVLEGVPATGIFPDFPVAPDTPADAISIAICDMAPAAVVWTATYSAIREDMNNCTRTGSVFNIVNGDRAAYWSTYDPNIGFFQIYIQAPNVLSDGDPILWGTEAISIGPSGQAEVNNKMPLAGGTFTGQVTHSAIAHFDAGIEVDADDVASFVFDDWVTFTRHAPAAAANSKDWVFHNFYWQAITSGPGTLLIVPIPQYIGAELVSVDVDCKNSDLAVDYDIEAGLSKIPYGDLASTVDFSEETFGILHNTQEVNDLVVKDPVTPFGALPYAFVDGEMLVLKIKTGAEPIQFFGARFNYRRKRIAI